jgi:predicted DCC family thiol-disulfide oxidoreductase YuxK
VTRWTGGQYSLLRAIVGAGLLVGFASHAAASIGARAGRLAAAEAALAAVGAASAAAFALGAAHRAAAVVLAATLCGYAAVEPAVALPIVVPLSVLLVAHCVAPPGPLGALAARGDDVLWHAWRMPAAAWIGAWLVLGAAHLSAAAGLWLAAPGAGSGALSPLGAAPPHTGVWPAFVAAVLGHEGAALATSSPGARLTASAALALVGLLACAAPARRWVWPVLALAQLVRIAWLGDASGGLAWLALLGLAFDPGWIPPRRAAAGRAPVLYYDGACGLCHRSVRVALAEDIDGALRVAPLDGEHFAATVPKAARAALPDSLVFDAGDGVLRVRSAGVLAVAAALGGLWRAFAAVSGHVPARWLDRAYDAVARVRHRLFRPPPAACPSVPPTVRERLLP